MVSLPPCTYCHLICRRLVGPHHLSQVARQFSGAGWGCSDVRGFGCNYDLTNQILDLEYAHTNFAIVRDEGGELCCKCKGISSRQHLFIKGLCRTVNEPRKRS